MRHLIKLSKQVNGIVIEQRILNRHVIHFSNVTDTIWKGTKRFAH